MSKEKVLSREFMMKPSECNASRELPLPLLVAQIIDLATDHANNLGIGFLNLESRGLGWVLVRLSVEMKRWPKNSEKYILSTWIESYNAHFSERNFAVMTNSGEVLGYLRTIWTIIDLNSHKGMGTANTALPPELIAGSNCPISKHYKNRHFEALNKVEYVFRYCDLDFYRHVNTVRYISLLLNQFTLEDFDNCLLSRFDIAFAHEARYGEKAVIHYMDEMTSAPPILDCDLPSVRRNFEIMVENVNILSASIIMTKKLQ